MNDIYLDTDTTLVCERCERDIEPSEPKLIFGWTDLGGTNWIVPFCAVCAQGIRDYV